MNRNPVGIGRPGNTVGEEMSRVYPQQRTKTADRTAETLLGTIRACIRPDITVISDLWRTYNGEPIYRRQNRHLLIQIYV